MVTKEEISQEALTWIGTPFHHQGRKKSVGVDCIGLIVGIAKNLDLKSNQIDVTNNRTVSLHEFDRCDYSAAPSKNHLVEVLEKLCIPIEKESLDVGDIVLFTFKRWPQHVGIITEKENDTLMFVHASQPVRKTTLSRYDERWSRQSAGYFRFPSLNFI